MGCLKGILSLLFFPVFLSTVSAFGRLFSLATALCLLPGKELCVTGYGRRERREKGGQSRDVSRVEAGRRERRALIDCCLIDFWHGWEQSRKFSLFARPPFLLTIISRQMQFQLN